jgi:hypothetical protein
MADKLAADAVLIADTARVNDTDHRDLERVRSRRRVRTSRSADQLELFCATETEPHPRPIRWGVVKQNTQECF